MIFFSVVIPTYNRAALLLKTIQSVLDQSFKSFEIIIVDDGSTDNTASLVIERYSKNRKVVYFWKENQERGVARNFGLKKARGKYVQFLDSDDYMKKNHLDTLYNHLCKYPDLNFLTTKSILIRNGNSIKMPIVDLNEGFYTYKDLLKGAPFGSLICIKKSNPNLILFTENREIVPLEDWVFSIQNTINDKIYLIDKITIQINDHEDRSMANHNFVIQKRIYASHYLIQSESFTEYEEKLLLAYSYYFCSVHAYLGGLRIKAIRFLNKSTQLLGLKLFLIILLFKIIIGKPILDKIKTFYNPS